MERQTKTRAFRRYDPLAARPPLALAGMRVGLLGGSFNPAHEGHLHISTAAMKLLGLQRLWWLVTPGNPLKCSDGAQDNLKARVASARAVAKHPRMDVTAFEAGLPTPYTVDTAAFLLRRFPAVHFVWIMGGDNLAQFHRWRRWSELFTMMPILVMDRPDARPPALASPAARRFEHARIAEAEAGMLALMRPPAWAYITIPLSYQSSTAIREASKS